MPPAMTASETASAARAGDVLATVSFSQKWAMPIETSGSAVVMMASTGEMRMPAWKAFWLSRKPTDRTAAAKLTVARPPLGWATPRNQATPAVQKMSPATMIGSG